MARPKRETPEQLKAYALYAAMGERRSLERVAEELGRPKSTLELWSRKWGWQERLRKDEAAVKSVLLQRVSERVVKNAEQFKTESMQLVDAALEKAGETLAEGKMDLTRPGDIVNLIKTGLLLRGEATERKETVQIKAKENAMKILQMVRVGGDALAPGPGGDIPVFAVKYEAGNEAADSGSS